MWSSSPRVVCVSILALVTLVSWPSGGASARASFRPWTLPIEDAPGLLSPDVIDIDGDRQGRIWIATAEGGASRYDPRDGSWLTFAEGYALRGTQVVDVHVDRRGDVWFATEDDGVYRWESGDGSWTRFDERDGAVDGGYRILEDSRGWLWVVGFERGLSHYRPRERRWVAFPQWAEGADAVFHDVVEGADGTIWAQNYERLIAYDRAADLWTRVAAVPAEVHAELSAIHAGPDGGIWLGDWFGGVGHLSAVEGEYRQIVAPRDGATDRRIEALLATPEGELWAGTYARGFYRIDVTTGELRDAADRRPDEWGAMVLHRDRSGDVWAGSWGTNLRRFDRASRTWLEAQAHHLTSAADVTAVYEDRRGTLWFGTRGGGVLRCDGRTGEWTQLPMRRDGAVGGDRINDVAAGPGGELWFTSSQVLSGMVNGTGVRGGGVHRFDRATGAWTTYRAEEGISDASAWTVTVTAGGEVVVGGLFGLRVLDCELGRWNTVRYTSYSDPGYVRALAAAADGRVWAIGDPGRVVGSRPRLDRAWHAIDASSELEGRRLRWLVADPRGDLWGGTDDRGLARLPRDSDDWMCCSRGKQGGDAITGMAFSTAGEGWLWSSDGRVAPWMDGVVKGRWRSAPNGVRGRHDRGIAMVDSRGAAWVAYHDGLVRFDRDDEQTDVFTGDDGMAGVHVDAGAEDDTGALWLGDDGEGVTRLVLDGRGPHHPLVLDGLPPEVSPGGLMRDAGGDAAGICWARPSGLMLSTRQGAVTTPLSPVRDWTTGVAGSTGGCWAGHFLSGVVFVDRDGRVRRFGTDEGLPDPQVTDMSPVPGSARVWVATNDGAALVDANQGVVHIVTADQGSSAGVVDRILALPDGGALLVFEAHDLRWFGDDAVDTSRLIPHLRHVSPDGEVGPIETWPGGEVRDLVVGGDGVVWLVTDLGLTRLEDGETTWIPAPLPEDGDRLRHVTADPTGTDDRIWLALDGDLDENASVLVHDPARETWRSLGVRDGLPATGRIDVLETDGRGGVVVVAGGRVVRGRGR